MQEMIDYILLMNHKIEDLNNNVNKKLVNGWKLYGSPSVACCTDTDDGLAAFFTQAVVRYE